MTSFLDVSGTPGAGKSTICNPIWHEHSIQWDGMLPPADWEPFLSEITTLFSLIRNHWSYVPAVRMVNRSIKKMATVSRLTEDRPYIQTGLVQRGLGFGWRLYEQGADVNLIREYFWKMPISLGVAFLEADIDTLLARNAAREKVQATAHENRSYQVHLVQPAIKIAKEVLRARGVPVISIDVQNQSPDSARSELVAFANDQLGDFEALGHRREVGILQFAPKWWQY